MATRLYYVATTAASATPSPDAGWADTTGFVRRRMATAQAAATETLSGTLSGSAGDNKLACQLISAPLDVDQTITGTFSIISRGRELAIQDNVNKRYRCLKVINGDGSSVRGTLFSFSTSAATTELSTSLAGQQHALTGSVSSVAALAGDRILLEVGYGEDAAGTTPNWEMVLGGTGTDHGTANNDTTGTVPWMEFSQNLTFGSDLTAVGKDLQLIWDVRSALGDTLQAIWDVRAVAGDSVQAVWDVRAAVGDPLQLIWDVRQAVGDPLELLWDVRSVVGDAVELVWNVEAAPLTAGKNLALVWDVRAAVADSLSVSWDVRQAVGDALELVWAIEKFFYFTPPHRGNFAERYIPGTETDTAPLRNMAATNPRPPNIYVWDDGTLHEGRPDPNPNPNIPGWTRRIYAGGHIYGPLTQAEITELTAAGYGAYVHDVPTGPEP